MNYIEKVIKNVEEKNSNEKEFIQSVREVLETLTPIIDSHKEFEKVALLERMVEPERIITFRVPWVDDNNVVHMDHPFIVL